METSWYKQNYKKLNDLLRKLQELKLRGNYENDLNLSVVCLSLSNMAKEISELQNEVVILKTENGKLKQEIDELKGKNNLN